MKDVSEEDAKWCCGAFFVIVKSSRCGAESERRGDTKMSYKKGRAYEYKIAERWRRKGAVVWRSPASKGAADLLIITERKIKLVQAKLQKGKKRTLLPSEEKALIELAQHIYNMLNVCVEAVFMRRIEEENEITEEEVVLWRSPACEKD